MKRKKADWVVLTIITMVAALCLGITNMLTKDKIKVLAEQAAKEALLAIFPHASEFVNDDTLSLPENIDQYKVAKQSDGTVLGYIGQITTRGFAGPVEVLIGVDSKGVITGLNAGGPDFSETPGIGTKVQEPEFTNLFVNLNASPSTVDTISGSTVTSKSVIQGATTVYEFIMNNLGLEIATSI